MIDPHILCGHKYTLKCHVPFWGQDQVCGKWQHIKLYIPTSSHFTWYDMTSYIASYRTVPYHTEPYRASYHIVSYRIVSYHIISYHIIAYHIISYHIIYHIISYHIIYQLLQHKSNQTQREHPVHIHLTDLVLRCNEKRKTYVYVHTPQRLGYVCIMFVYNALQWRNHLGTPQRHTLSANMDSLWYHFMVTSF